MLNPIGNGKSFFNRPTCKCVFAFSQKEVDSTFFSVYNKKADRGESPVQVKRRSTQVGRRGAPAKGVGRDNRREGSNPSFSASVFVCICVQECSAECVAFCAQRSGLSVFNKMPDEKLASFPLRYEIAT